MKTILRVGAVLCALATAILAQAQSCATAPSGLVSFWPGDGDAKDIASTNHLSFTGATTFSSGESGQAFAFLGNNYVSVPDNASLRPTSLTVMGWFALNRTTGLQQLLAKVVGTATLESYGIWMNGGTVSSAICDVTGPGITQSYTLNPAIGTWHHFAQTFDDATKQAVLYVDGLPRASGISTKSVGYDSNPLQIGAEYDNQILTYYVSGKMDEVALFNRALTSNEIAAIYAAGTNGMCKALQITTQPQSRAVLAGSNASFSVIATGQQPLSYQWLFGSTPLSSTSSSLTVTNVQAANVGSYYAVVTDSSGSLTSAAAALTIATVPSITTQPQSQTVAQGSPTSFSVVADGTAPLSYQWSKDGVKLAGATTSSYSITNVQPANIGNYTVVVTNAYGTVTSSAASLSIPGVPTGIWQGLIGYYLFNGNAADVSGNGNNGNPTNVVFNTDRFGNTNSSADFSSNAFVEIPTLKTMPYYPVTYSLWFNLNRFWLPSEQRPSDSWSDMTLIGREITGNITEGAVCLQYVNGGPPANIVYFTAANTFSSLQTPQTNQWVQLVFTQDASNNAAFYWNGQLIKAGTFSATQTAAIPFRIGASASFSDYRTSWKGSIDDVRIYNRALSSNDVAQLYASEAPASGPSITTQPQSVTVAQGSNAVFSVVATGNAPLTYQWRKDGANLAGATASALTINNAQGPNIGDYSVVVANGIGSATSATATLSIQGIPSGIWQGLVAYYPFSGNAQDASANGNNGNPTNVVYGPDRNGQTSAAADFSSGDAWVDVPTLNAMPYYPVTYSAWYKLNSYPTAAERRNDGYFIMTLLGRDVSGSFSEGELNLADPGPDNMVTYYTGTSGVVGFHADTNVWTHVTFTLDSSNNATFYKNGQLINSNVFTASQSDVIPFRIGASAALTDNRLGWKGLIDDVRIYNRALASNEVAQLYSSEAPVPPVSSCVTPPSGLVSFWPADGDAKDVVSTNNGTFLGGATFAAGESGQAFALGGSNYVSAADNASLRPASLTVMGWFSLNRTSGLQQLIAKVVGTGTYESYGVWMINGSISYAICDVNGPGITQSYALNPTLGTWYHFAQTFDDATKQAVLYVNGVAVASGVSTKSIGYDSNPLQIGAEFDNQVLTYYLSGKMDEVALFNRALTSNEIATIYAAGSNSFCKTLAITTQPQSQTVVAGQAAAFSVAAIGQQPLSYAWSFNGSPLGGATNSVLTIANAQNANVGSYSVVVSDISGSVTSTTATLAVNTASSVLFENFEPGIHSNLWSAFGGIVIATNYGGYVSPVNSGWFGGDGSRFITTVPINAASGGAVNFSLRIANGSSFPWELADLPGEGIVLEYSVNSGTTWTTMGTYNTSAYFVWTNIQANIPAGAQTSATLFRWRQLSNSGASFDHWALDDIQINAGPSAPSITAQPQSQTVLVGGNANLSVGAVGTATLTYQWQQNGANLVGATNSNLSIAGAQTSNAGTYDVVVCNGLGCVTSSNAVLSVVTNNLALGLIAYYPFNGNASDASGNGNNGNPTNVVFNTDRFGNTNSSADFSSNAFVEIPTLNTMAYYPVTYSLWCNLNRYWLPSEQRPSDAWSDMTLIGREVSGSITEGAVCFQHQNGGNPPTDVVYFTGANSFSSFQIPLLNQWVQVVFTLDASNNAAFYWNGQLVKSGTFNATQNAALAFRIGASASLTDYRTSWKGSIDDVRVYNRALSSNEVAQLYTSEAPAPTPSTVPTITSYTPTSGPIGTVVTINGSNFGTNTTDNVVVFGGVQAQVLTASATQLTAVVPTGATYSAPKVTVAGLTAVAAVPFDVTFPSSGAVSSASLAAPFVLPSGSPPGIYQFVDIDGDGKADLVCLAGSGSASVLSTYRNVGTNGILTVNSFAPRVDIALPQAYGWMDVSDIDGDGKLDVVASSPGGVVSVFRNQSTPGNVSFAARVDLAALSDPEGVKIGDIDGDGKLDIVTANYGNNSGSTISVFRNLSSAGTITSNSFALRQDFTVGASPYTLALGDIDGDGKLDVIVPARGSSIVSILRNTSPVGGVSFARQDFGVGSWPMTVAVSDLDADGKVDVLVGNYMGNSISIFKNNSTPGAITLGTRMDLPTATGGRPHGINIADMDGDGKPDILAVTEIPDGLMIWRNQGTNGTFTLGSLAAPVTFSTGWNPWYPAVMDLDGDGKPDVIVDEVYAADALVFHNVMAGPEPTIVGQPQSQTTAVGTSAAFSVGVTGSTPLNYQWFVNGSSISGATTSSYTVSNPQLSDDGSSYSVVVTNSYDTATSSNAVLTVGLAPTISPQPASQTVAETKNATFTANVSGTAPFSYQWRFNGGSISGATNSTLSIINAQQSDAGTYSFVVSSPFGTATSSDAVLTVVRSTLVAGNVSGAGSSLVTEPISLIAVGSENALGFSLAFDPAMLSVQSVALGSNSAGATLFFNTNNPGTVGVIVSLPTSSSFTQGTQEVALVTFKAGLIATQTVTAINFADSPTTRQVSDDLANSLPASYVNGSATLSATVFEGDVSPRTNGNQNVTTTDWVQVGRFVAGLDTIASPSEFQRADCAPRSSLGNGNLTVSDWVQAGRYAVGLDPLTAVGGPTSNGSHAPAQPKTPTTRSITLDMAAKNGVTNLVSVELNAQGNENAVGFSLTFDNKLLQFAGASVGTGAPGASLNVNSLQASNGTIGVALAMPIGQTFNSGTQECVRLSFVPASYSSGTSNLAFSDSPVIREVSDVTANALSAAYMDASMNVTGLVPPLLTIGQDGSGHVVVTWPATAGFGLESSSNPGTNWSAVSAVPVTNGGNATITQPISGDTQFFRLRKP